jgi:nucleotide-binding universal stress UspA family protein
MIILKNVLVATDFSPPSEAALTYARALARTFGASLHVLHVVENFFMRATPSDPHAIVAAKRRTLNEHLTDEDRYALQAQPVIKISDTAADAIVEYAREEKIDLIVMGTNGRTAVSQLLVGSVAERVVRIASCPVLTIRHPEHEFVIPDSQELRGGHDSPQEDPRRN